MLKQLNAAIKAGDSQRKALKKPHDDAGKAIQDDWNPGLNKGRAGAGALKGALSPYRTAKQEAKEKAAREAQEAADRLQQEAQEAMIASKDDLEARFEAETKLEMAQKQVKAASKVDRAPTGLRGRTVARVTDHKALLIWIANNDKEALDAFLEQYAQRAIPTKPDGVAHEIEKVAA